MHQGHGYRHRQMGQCCAVPAGVTALLHNRHYLPSLLAYNLVGKVTLHEARGR